MSCGAHHGCLSAGDRLRRIRRGRQHLLGRGDAWAHGGDASCGGAPLALILGLRVLYGRRLSQAEHARLRWGGGAGALVAKEALDPSLVVLLVRLARKA